MEVLPLFPLPVVLFPGAPMPLHIFEARYRRMVGRCLEFDKRFGLLHHDSDEDGPFLNEAGQVGTVAVIEEFQPLSDGRSLVLVRGEGDGVLFFFDAFMGRVAKRAVLSAKRLSENFVAIPAE